MPGWHTIIRGLAPQAGGFRRRSNRIASVGLSAWLIVVNERLPCVLQVVAATCSSVSYLNTCQTCNPGSDPVASHAQYITNRIHRSPHSRGTESSTEKDPRASSWQSSLSTFPCRQRRFRVFVIYMEMSTTSTRTAGAESVSAIFIFVSAIFDFVSAKIQNGSAKIWLFDVEISLRG